MDFFDGKTLLISGGTGSFGRACLNRFLNTNISKIRVFSRDETKQDEMRHIYHDTRIDYYIGDIRNYESINDAMHNVDYVFHAAALKEVPSCEFFPMEAVKTNIIGTDNILRAAVESNVKGIVCLSTDKAAYPINTMGMSKAIMEKIMSAKARTVDSNQTLICATRYGNVMASRGSVIPLFINQIKNGEPITVTEPLMTRFLMSLEQAIDLVVYAFEHGQSGDILIKKAPASTIGDLAQAIIELFDSKSQIKIIGKRHGEKMYETLVTEEEMQKAIDEGDYFRIPSDNRDLNYDIYYTEGFDERRKNIQFNSDNAYRMNIDEIKNLLLSIDYVKDQLEIWRNR